MLNKKDTIAYLQAMELSRDESLIYLELLRQPSSHLELARTTGVNRTKIYRLADQLEKRSLITTQTDDRGTTLVASDPTTLEVELVTREEKLRSQRVMLKKMMPNLESIRESQDSPLTFAVQTYEGVEGFKQMLWHELKTKGEALILGSGSLEDLVISKRWSENHRAHTVEAGYFLRELLNPDGKSEIFTKNDRFMEHYSHRYLKPGILQIHHQVSIYNDTVATYSWQNDQRVGVEIINHANAEMMRQMFEHYWQLAETG